MYKLLDILTCRHHRDDDISISYCVFETQRLMCTQRYELSYFSWSTIVEGSIPSFGDEIFCHRDTHESHTDKCDIHRKLINRSKSLYLLPFVFDDIVPECKWSNDESPLRKRDSSIRAICIIESLIEYHLFLSLRVDSYT